MAPLQPPRLLATLLVLDDLRPQRQRLQRVFADLDDQAASALERQVRLCGSASVFTGCLDQAREHGRRLRVLGLTTTINLCARNLCASNLCSWPALPAALAQGLVPAA